MSKVYFSKSITPETLVKLYDLLGRELCGNVAVKLSSGEPGGHHFLSADLIRPLVEKVRGTIVECNTAYQGKRFHTEDHYRTMQEHGFAAIAPVEILDGEGELSLPVKNGRHLKENVVGQGLSHYDSMLVLSHFKGHPMGGFGGAIKNIAIGVASSYGKKIVHGAGDAEVLWDADHDSFLESMAEATSSVLDYLGKDNFVYVSVANLLSVDCDCLSNPAAPQMADIGVFASLDPVSLDRACVDAVYASEDAGKVHLIERIESRNGTHTLDAAEALGLGSQSYELIKID